ncbi:phage tail protein [Myxococcus llanfairpwllgwyngyllgogerychwyrndrobwllllantysiliogogogochensis]|uniref:Phage tail protein n=1 Tax=Myxococcus llanfairpwllgwyngyllgogerychwyrndrobwllllantysiliogogogochensis TaxID=2590453 RepID=A0A540WTZ2_9BACT|nr:phage tail protein [Myxococcus llanfairpwllgwyngyllgogerychwyrndrobwllllantysiliogogogochensis]TQF12478.1 phage tail protein [Myxococcus llanfairpwllgwyngyllgogerychwyrndrobwllllantysiliogogogochensis]
MSNKHKLLAKNRRVMKSVEIDGVKVNIIKPTMGDRLRLIEQARAAGEMTEQNEPTGDRAGARMLARIAVCVMNDAETGRPMFAVNDLDELLDESWLEDFATDLTDVFNVTEGQMRGK